jgi:hypothetical protein
MTANGATLSLPRIPGKVFTILLRTLLIVVATGGV